MPIPVLGTISVEPCLPVFDVTLHWDKCRIDRCHDAVDDGLVSEAIGVVTSGPAKRVLRSAEEKRRIVEATFVPGASIARVARVNGVNANQVFQWRHEYRKGTGWAAKQPRAQLLPVMVTAEPSSITVADVASVPSPSTGSIHIELPGRRVVSVEAGVDVTLVRAVLESLLR